MKRLALTILFTAAVLAVHAQGKRISGVVTDPFGPVVMANVTETDASNRIVSATQTDFNGNFSLAVKNENNRLVVSYVGNKRKVLSIGAKTSFKVMMEPEDTQVKEVVVKGTRTSSGGLSIPKREVSVAQQTFDMETVEGLAFTTADEALQGEIAGLDIVQNSGNLGAGTTMRLRGVTTVNGNAEPLIVVDDKIFDNPDASFDFQNATEEEYASLLSVNTEDIASISVLKDAAATAVWGSKGTNGVIMITTKRGSRGKVKIGFNYKFTGTWQPDGYEMLNGDDYTMLLKEAFYNPAQKSDATTGIEELNYNTSWAEYENWNNNTDWVKAVKQFGQMHSYNVNMSGGGQKTTFRISAGYDYQTGSIIKQRLDRFTARLVLDYFVSDRMRFSTNFPLTYTNNVQNYAGLLGIAQKAAPNMSIYRQRADGSDTGEFYIMGASGDPSKGRFSSSELSDIMALGNPVAIANLAWKKDRTYRLSPDFELRYELLGHETGKTRLTFKGRVDFDIYARNVPTYHPAELTNDKWTVSNYNLSANTESNRFKVGGRVELDFTPHFKNEDIYLTMLGRYEMSSSKSSGQFVSEYELPHGITSPTAGGELTSSNGMTSTNSRSNSQYWIYNMHASYKGRYILGFSLRADGDSRFGPKEKWAYFPGLSLRYNISDEAFMKPLKKVVSLLGLRASWGRTGNAPTADYLFYNSYNTSAGAYGNNGSTTTAASINGMKLDDLRWELTTATNLGFNLSLFDERIEIDFDYYNRKTTDMLMKTVDIPYYTGYSSVAYRNTGRMDNRGWELNVNARNIIKKGKFSVSAGFNFAQNQGELKEMDDQVLESLNQDWIATSRGTYLNRIQTGNPLGSIYGLRYKGVYQYSYEYLENYRTKYNLTDRQYEEWINARLAEGKTFPVATNADGKVVMLSTGSPKRMVYDYKNGSSTYKFQGGDAIYEDVNHDGQINSLDIMYLGNSMPKLNGGFNFSFRYGNWSVKTRFMYRLGNKIVNLARMNLEQMYTTYNQSVTVNWRWTKDGDVTPMPRAMYNTGFNWQGSDRYVEDGSFLRFQNLQVSYSFPAKQIKKWGLANLQLYGSMNNLYCWTRYSGVDPEISIGAWGVSTDNSQTPRAKTFTLTLNIGF